MEKENTPTPEEQTLPGITSPEDGFSPEEAELYRQLNARYKKLQRRKASEEKFYKKADECRDTLLQRWKEKGLIAETVGTSEGTPEKSFCDQIKAAYGTDISDQKLLKFLTREKVVRSFRDRIDGSPSACDPEIRAQGDSKEGTSLA